MTLARLRRGHAPKKRNGEWADDADITEYRIGRAGAEVYVRKRGARIEHTARFLARIGQLPVNRFFESRVYTKGCNVQFTHIAVLSIAAKITGVLLYISGGCLF